MIIEIPGKFMDWFEGTGVMAGHEDRNSEARELREGITNGTTKRYGKGYAIRVELRLAALMLLADRARDFYGMCGPGSDYDRYEKRAAGTMVKRAETAIDAYVSRAESQVAASNQVQETYEEFEGGHETTFTFPHARTMDVAERALEALEADDDVPAEDPEDDGLNDDPSDYPDEAAGLDEEDGAAERRLAASAGLLGTRPPAWSERASGPPPQGYAQVPGLPGVHVPKVGDGLPIVICRYSPQHMWDHVLATTTITTAVGVVPACKGCADFYAKVSAAAKRPEGA